MHWVIQDNLYADDGTNALVDLLPRLGVPFSTVSMLSASGTLSPDVHPSGPVMVCGSVGLARVAQERGWQPGSFRNHNHRYKACMTHWRREMLNADACISAFNDVRPVGERVFIRPAEESKYFNGGVMDSDEVRAWRDAVVEGKRSPVRCSPRMDGNTQVVCGPLVVIHKECRFFVVDGEVAAWSTYKQGSAMLASPEVDPVSMDYARACLDTWQPARAFVLDIALTLDGPRIIEVNCINSAGFYGADVERIVRAVEGMEPWASA